MAQRSDRDCCRLDVAGGHKPDLQRGSNKVKQAGLCGKPLVDQRLTPSEQWEPGTSLILPFATWPGLE